MKKNFDIIEEIYNDYLQEKTNEFSLYIIFDNKISLNNKNMTWEWEDFKQFSHKRIFNLKNEENYSVIILLFELLIKRYTKEEIYLEKRWTLGHTNSGYLDIAVYHNKVPVYFFEVKQFKELYNYVTKDNETKTKQLFSYVWQEKEVKIASYYSFDFDSKQHIFKNFKVNRKLINNSSSLDDFFDSWDGIWDSNAYILNQKNKFDIEYSVLTYNDLKDLSENYVKFILSQFLTILRVNTVSDKSNAFDKMINLFIAKIADELSEGSKFFVNSTEVNGIKFQFIEGKDDKISLLTRLNDLYKEGMDKYLDKQIIDYSLEDLKSKLKVDNKEVIKMFENLRLKKDNAFSFIEVFDEETFEQNFIIVKEIVKLLQETKFKYNNKFQYLGNFFEELLNTSWKQEAGQFFTPMPLVNMIVESLPIEEKLTDNIKKNKNIIVPKAIDYACGSGHFLVAYMDRVQNILENKAIGMTSLSTKKIDSYKTNPFSWAKESVYGIEKDYRLSKTTKVSTFLNGDGEATILNGNGLDKFNSSLFSSTKLYSEKKTNPIFDFVITNPPYSIKGFLKSLKSIGVDKTDFSMFEDLNMKSSEIEVLFLERAEQVLKEDGIAAIILPRSILAAKKYEKMRKYIFKNFEINVIFEFGDITFGGTSTSPVVLFLTKKEHPNKKYDVLIINSPKVLFQNSKLEKEFLGYKFSSNKNKPGIEEMNNNLTKTYSPMIYNHLLGKNSPANNYSFIKDINDIILKDLDTKEDVKIFTRFTPKDASEYIPLAQISVLVKKDNDNKIIVAQKKLKYLEIGNIQKDGTIKASDKNKTTTLVTKKGDLLIPSIISPFGKWNFAIADKEYCVSSAIYVLRFKNDLDRNYLYDILFNNKENIIENMQSLAEGFKITYSKISSFNLMNNVFVNKAKLQSYTKNKK